MAGTAKPVVGIIGNAQVVNDRHNVQLVGQRNMRAIAEVAGALPLMFAGTPDITDVDALLGAVDGILLTGARANVHPTCFGVEPDPRHEPYDQHRDAMALSLIKACVERGLGVAVLSEVTFDPSRDVRLRAIKLGALVAPSITSVAVRHRRLRGYEYDFISMCSPDWTRARVDGVLSRRDLTSGGSSSQA